MRNKDLKRRNQIGVIMATLLTIVIALTMKIDETKVMAAPQPSSAMSNQSTMVNSTEVQVISPDVETVKDSHDVQTGTVVGEVGMTQNPEGESVLAMKEEVAKTEPKREFYFVTVDGLNVRANPYAESKIIKVLNQKDHFEVVKVKGQWLQLKEGGWVYGQYTSYKSLLPKVDEKKKPTATKPTPSKSGKPANPVSAGVNSSSNLSVSDVEKMLPKAMGGRSVAKAIVEVEEKYGINALFTIAVAKLESGNGKSRLAKNKNNLFGLNATGSVYNNANGYSSKAASVHDFGRIISKYYIKQGRVTLKSINAKYCPPNPKWKNLVSDIIKGDLKKI